MDEEGGLLECHGLLGGKKSRTQKVYVHKGVKSKNGTTKTEQTSVNVNFGGEKHLRRETQGKRASKSGGETV